MRLPRRPSDPILSLARGHTNFWLTMPGEVGRLYHLLERTTLANANWQTNLSLTLTNPLQTISLPLPKQPVNFWRVRVP